MAPCYLKLKLRGLASWKNCFLSSLFSFSLAPTLPLLPKLELKTNSPKSFSYEINKKKIVAICWVHNINIAFIAFLRMRLRTYK